MSKEGVFVHVGNDGGKVVLLFSSDPQGNHPVEINRWYVDPAEAIPITEAIARHAFEADTSLKPVGDSLKASLVERHRMTLTQRLSVMLNSMRDDKSITNGKLAQNMVDAMLKEVF